MKLMDTYSKEEFAKIVMNSTSYADCLKKLGYASNSGSSTKLLKEKIQNENLSVSHFETKSLNEKTVRTEENVFCTNSTANQSTLRKFYLKKHPQEKCQICGQVPFWNNKPLTLILDHINGFNHDNRLENLRWVCPNCNIQLETTNARNPNHKKYYCEKCGKQVSQKGVKLCLNCYKKEQNENHIQRKNARPSREELKKLIREKPFTQIGKQFNVSDNAIRKWCDSEKLPKTKQEINSYSDIEWENI